MTPRILIIAGSDSGGGAGIQADIKTVTMLGGHAMTAITAITAQNTLGVTGVIPVPADFVVAQMDAVLSDIGADVVKIGMIGSAETVHAVAERLEPLGLPIVFDPVMVATSGSVLADEATIAAFSRLMRISTLVTPNIPELAALTGNACASELECKIAAEDLAADFGCAVLAKGGHRAPEDTAQTMLLPDGELTRDLITDWLIVPPGQWHGWSDPRIDTAHTHGTGCTLASAVATGLADGLALPRAVERARLFVRLALREAPGFGGGHGPMGHQRVRLDLPDLDGPTLNQLTLPAGDYEASVAFYRLLGCRQIVASPPRYARFEAPGGVTLSIEVRNPLDPPSSTEHFFQCADLDSEVARLAGQGVEFDVMPEDRPYLWRVAEMRDPHGNRICLYQTGEIRRFPPWRMG
jgi:hydroxymethylpyrimidine/phosphomethylpyrimidine kinase